MDDQREEVLEEYFLDIFGRELEGWVVDDALWLQNRDLKTINRWFDVEFHSMVLDLGEQPLQREES